MEKFLIVFLVGALVWAIGYQPNYREGETLERVQAIIDEARSLEQERRQAYVDAHPELPERTRNLILLGGIHYGMTDEQVIASMGEPSRRNVRSGGREQWVYGRRSYLHFRRSFEGNLELESWQVFGE